MPIPAVLVTSLIEAIAGLLSKRRKLRSIVLPLLEQAEADGTLPDNAARRAWVLAYLMNEQGMSESTARMLIEAGVQLAKKLKRKAEKKAARKAKKES